MLDTLVGRIAKPLEGGDAGGGDEDNCGSAVGGREPTMSDLECACEKLGDSSSDEEDSGDEEGVEEED